VRGRVSFGKGQEVELSGLLWDGTNVTEDCVNKMPIVFLLGERKTYDQRKSQKISPFTAIKFCVRLMHFVNAFRWFRITCVTHQIQ
jgi:hypothetical protein